MRERTIYGEREREISREGVCVRERERERELMVTEMTLDTTPGNGDNCPVVEKHARGGRSERAERQREIERQRERKRDG